MDKDLGDAWACLYVFESEENYLASAQKTA